MLGGFAAAALLLTAFTTWELRVRRPMLDVRLFRNARFSAASGAISLPFFALFGMIFFLTPSTCRWSSATRRWRRGSACCPWRAPW